jgi:hypothetical protein
MVAVSSHRGSKKVRQRLMSTRKPLKLPDNAALVCYALTGCRGRMTRRQKSWELRAAMRMARLWRDQGKRDKARDLLAPI